MKASTTQIIAKKVIIIVLCGTKKQGCLAPSSIFVARKKAPQPQHTTERNEFESWSMWDRKIKS